jgi:hypothetical protein
MTSPGDIRVDLGITVDTRGTLSITGDLWAKHGGIVGSPGVTWEALGVGEEGMKVFVNKSNVAP